MHAAAPHATAPYSRTAPAGDWDTIVVGSGMGGMSCAAMLGELGQRVLIVEQHYVPGGMTQVFRRGDYTWDVGVHAVGEVSADDRLGRLLAHLSHGRIEWCSLGPVCDEFHYPGGRIDLPASRERFVAGLNREFPDERAAIAHYIEIVDAVANATRDHFLRRTFSPQAAPRGRPVAGGGDIQHWIRRRTRDVLREITADERLVSVLSAQWGYYGAAPSESSFVIHALVTRHFWNGGYYPRGGSESIARGLLQTVADHGGWTQVGASVRDLLFDGGRVCGVRLDGGEEILARRVVSAIGGIATVEHLLPPDLRAQEWAQGVAALEPSPAHLCLHLGFEGDIRDAGASGANRWFFETWSHTPDEWHLDAIPDPIPILYTSFPSLKDPDHDPGPRQRHTGAAVTFVPHEDFARFLDTPWRRRGAEYEAIKADLSDRILRQLLRHMPGLAPMVRYTELSTPLTTAHFTRATRGAIYGVKPTPARFLEPGLHPRTPVPGLFLSGTDVATVGVMGACLGGILTASAIEPVKAMRILRDAR